MSVTDPALWLLVTSSTQSFAEQTSETLVMRGRLLGVAAKYRQCGIEHRAGHYFEVLHSWSFNLDAIRQRVDMRTDWVGQGNGPVDVRIVDGDHRILAEVQTKLMDNPSATAFQLRADRYAGMQRVVACDKAEDVGRYLDKGRRTFADREIWAGYADAEANLAVRIHVGDVRSTPMDRSAVHRVAEHPGRWAAAQSVRIAGRQVGAAAAAGAAFGAISGAGVEAIVQGARVHARETTTADAARSVAVAAGTGAFRSGAVAGLGEIVRIAFRSRFAGSAVPLAIASVAVDVAGAGIALARGEVDAIEFALRGGESVLGTVAAGAFAAVGQAVVPVPAVGFVVGGLVGQLTVAAVAGWIRSSVTEACDPGDPVVHPAAIEAVPAAEDLVAQVDAAIEQLSGWLAGICVDAATMASEFTAWMADPTSLLVLDPNPA